MRSGLANKFCRKFSTIRVGRKNDIYEVIRTIAGHVVIFDTTTASNDLMFHGTIDCEMFH